MAALPFRRSAVVLVAALVLGCSDEKPDSLVASAKAYLAKDDAAAAMVQLKSALQKQPSLAEARFLLGRTMLERGDAVGAEVELRKAQDLKYPDSEVLPPLVKALVLGGKANRAIKDFARVDLSDPMARAQFKVALASAYGQEGNAAKAHAELDQALSAVPDFAAALLMKARLSATEGSPKAAFELLDRVISKDPSSYEARQLKADLLFFANADFAGALDLHKQALSLRKDWLPSHSSILEMLMARRDLAGAKAQLGELRKVLPNHPQTKYFEAQVAFLEKDYKAAREIVQVLLKAAPENVKVLLLAGGIEVEGGSLLQAESYIAKALQLAPDVSATRRLLATIYVRTGETQKARDTLAPLLERPDVDGETLALAAQLALQNGEAAQAESLLGRAAKANPNNSRINTALALRQLAKGNADLAFAQLQNIAAADKGTVADFAIISARLRQRNFPAALKAIDGLERKQPNNPLAPQLRAEVQLALKDYPAARQSLLKAQSIDPLYFPTVAALASLDMREKKPEEAKKRFDKLLAADPKNLRALLAVAELRAKEGADKDEIAKLLANASKLNPTAPQPRLLLIDLHLRSKDTKAALAAAQEASAALPDNPELLEALGRTQLAAGDANQALSSFNKLVGMQRKSPQPYLRLAELHMTTKNYAAAREQIERALTVSPKYLPAQRALLSLELASGNSGKALEVARLVQSERPDQSIGYLFAGEVEATRKNWEAAIAAFRAGLKRGETTELASKLHSALTMARKDAEAEALGTRWIKEHPTDLAFRSYLGDRAITQRDWATAEGHYKAILQAQPENAIALNNVAWVSHKLGKPDAIAIAEKANTVAPGQPAFMDTLASILSDSGRLDQALELEKKALAISPDYHIARLNLAKIYLKSGDKVRAKAELDQLSKLGGKFAEQAEVARLLQSLSA